MRIRVLIQDDPAWPVADNESINCDHGTKGLIARSNRLLAHALRLSNEEALLRVACRCCIRSGRTRYKADTNTGHETPTTAGAESHLNALKLTVGSTG
jgi:hypothetical protein